MSPQATSQVGDYRIPAATRTRSSSTIPRASQRCASAVPEVGFACCGHRFATSAGLRELVSQGVAYEQMQGGRLEEEVTTAPSSRVAKPVRSRRTQWPRATYSHRSGCAGLPMSRSAVCASTAGCSTWPRAAFGSSRLPRGPAPTGRAIPWSNFARRWRAFMLFARASCSRRLLTAADPTTSASAGARAATPESLTSSIPRASRLALSDH